MGRGGTVDLTGGAGKPCAVSLRDYQGLVGTEIGVSPWMLVDQARIDGFAHITGDEQFIHVDPAAAAVSTFGGTIAHGFLSLSLLSAMSDATVPPIAGTEMTVNYGLNQLRFLSPVRSGSRIRGVFRLDGLSERCPGQWQSTFGVTIEIEGSAKPAMVAEWLTLAIVPPSAV